ncbi:ATP-dependent helicase DinG/Rad3 [Vibrio maritimus]|uniref:ATP-dependent helicase DinG/Rad3 n=1 Tax=Vibrio maritimus TaxID=990268 RepID=A0A090S1C0_9VIBR|nr:ATP-dependent helicase DinG/Rad3 [Vibrio maritimus]
MILPEPENTIFIFDEAHHLPHVARDHASASATLKGAGSWLERLNQSASKFSGMADEKRVSRFRNELQDAIQQLIPLLGEVNTYCGGLPFEEDSCRFENGELPSWLEEQAKVLKQYSQKGAQASAKIADLISERLKDGEISAKLAEPALAELGFYIQRFDNLAAVWRLMAEPQKRKVLPRAWIEKSKEREGDHLVSVAPLEVGWQLDQQLWSRCVGLSWCLRPCVLSTLSLSSVIRLESAKKRKTEFSSWR